VTGRVLLTHQGKYQARLLGDRLAAEARGEQPDLARWGAHAATADDAAVPQVVFTDPEVAAVGLTERAAAERGLRTRLVTYDLGSVAGASLAADGYRGRAALLVDLDRRSSSARPSSGRTSPSCCTRRRSRSWARCRCPGCGTPSRRSRRSARCGSACWRRSEHQLERVHRVDLRVLRICE
jgi:hypothetical protein